ncbi:alpha/beta fold hydrolase [Actinospica durhamensis]|uniref:Alpha/beta fold hydrolase n=1 Tax=Actinospica durhamensis TaxID=1508375 RepID=A0A941EP50_9ACTN|nr:alpha/beta fold hydrolase [Actinospica durhamensis]MBR7833958.1 alpha/beta fold hydrolase [Actinospica durhamensis]
MVAIQDTEFRSPDGLRLRGTLVRPAGPARAVTVFVHGGGVTRDEGGFFTRLADGLAAAGIASLRFDLRGHGASEGRQEELTLAGVLGDIGAAVRAARQETGAVAAHLLAASFSGGISAYYTVVATADGAVQRLVLINPLLNYRKRFVDDKPYWADGQIDEEAGAELAARGFLAHSPTFKLGRPLLNEVFHLRPDEALDRVRGPVLIVHGTGDTFIPVGSSRALAARLGARAQLLEIEGAQHGIAVPDDPGYLDPRTRAWQRQVVEHVARWLAAPAEAGSAEGVAEPLHS